MPHLHLLPSVELATMLSHPTLLLCLAGSALALNSRAAVNSTKLVSYTKDQTFWPSYWTYDSSQPISLNEYIQLAIGLPQANAPGLETALLAISDPSSHSYGKFLSKDAALAFLKPKAGTTEAVDAWLRTVKLSISPPSVGVTVSSSGDWIDLNVTVSTANSLLGTNFTAYLQIDDYVRTLRATSYNIPKNLLSYIDTIQPTTIPNTGLTNSKGRRNIRETAASVKGKQEAPRGLMNRQSNTPPNPYPNCTGPAFGAPPPSCIREWYNVGNYTPLALPNNRIGM